MKKTIIAVVGIIVIAGYYIHWSNTTRVIDRPLPMPLNGKITVENVYPILKTGQPSEGYAVVDVRTDKEYKAHHTEGTIHIPLTLFDEDNGCSKIAALLPKDKKIIFVCPAGPRAEEMYYDLTDPVKEDGCGFNPKGMYFLIAKVKFKKDKLIIK